MECDFYVGQRVVCIDAHDTNTDGIPELEEGAVYTIARINTQHKRRSAGPNLYTRTMSGDSEAVVHLRECARIAEYGGYNLGFSHRRFRPLTDISDLEALLNTKPADIPQEELV